MPKLLAARLREDTIRQFRASARLRNEDAWCLATQGKGATAIYLWGYVTEMCLKAAWFSLLGFSENQAITFQDLRIAAQLATNNYGVSWPGRNYHAVFHWAQLLVQPRIAIRGAYPNPQFPSLLTAHCGRVYDRWREVLRYKKNRAYTFEVRAVAESSHWVLSNQLDQ
jgi:hypothetical protein